MSPIVLTQVCVFYRKIVLLLVSKTLKYTLFRLNHRYFPKHFFLKVMQKSFCTEVSEEKEYPITITPIYLSLYIFILRSWYILLKLVLRKRDFKFSPQKNLFRLIKAIGRDYLMKLIKSIFYFTIHILDCYKLDLFHLYYSYYRRRTIENRLYYKQNKYRKSQMKEIFLFDKFTIKSG